MQPLFLRGYVREGIGWRVIILGRDEAKATRNSSRNQKPRQKPQQARVTLEPFTFFQGDQFTHVCTWFLCRSFLDIRVGLSKFKWLEKSDTGDHCEHVWITTNIRLKAVEHVIKSNLIYIMFLNNKQYTQSDMSNSPQKIGLFMILFQGGSIWH